MDTRLCETDGHSAERAGQAAGTGVGELAEATSAFVDVRPRLFVIAYRILGNVGDAEDVVQDAWLRWQCTDRTLVLNPPAFLTTTTTRLAINVAQSARKRHEAYVGPVLPEQADTSVGPEARAERSEAVEQATLLLMEKLTPSERAAYVLRVGFAYSYRQISELLHLRVANTRQLVTRARQHIATRRRVTVDSAAHRRLVRAILAAAQVGNLVGLEELLAQTCCSVPSRK